MTVELLISLLVLLFLAAPVMAIIALAQINSLKNRVNVLEGRSARPGPSINVSDAAPPATPEPAPPGPDMAMDQKARPAPASLPERVAPEDDFAQSGLSVPPITSKHPSRNRVFERIEKSLAGNWMVWLGAVALALGGGFMVKAAADMGFFGPIMRISAAIVAGFAMIGAGEYLRRRPMLTAIAAKDATASAVAAAGLITLYAALLAAYALYHLIPGLIAFAGLFAIALLAFLLAFRHGGVIAGFGFTGALIAPALVTSGEPSAAILFGYVLSVCVAAIALARWRGWRWSAWISVAGGAIWPLIWLAGPAANEQTWALGLYLPAFLGLAIAFGWREAARPPPVDQPLKAWFPIPSNLVGGYFGGLAVFALALLFFLAAPNSVGPMASLLGLCVIALLACWRREGYAPLAPLSALALLLLLVIWPKSGLPLTGGVINLTTWFDRPEGYTHWPPYLGVTLGGALIYGLGGYAILTRLQVKSFMAVASAAFAPLALALAFWRLGELEASAGWGLAALTMTASMVWAALRLARNDGLIRNAGAVSAFALGASGSAALAAGMALEQIWMSMAFAVEALLAAWLWRRLPAPALKWAAAAFGLLATLRLTVLGEVQYYDIGPIPVYNLLLAGYGLTALVLWFAAREMRRGGESPHSVIVQGLESGALILASLLVFFQIRHGLNAGDLNAPLNDRVEFALQSTALLLIASALRWRFGLAARFGPRWTQRIALMIAALFYVGMLTILANPWWGPEGKALTGFGQLLLVYGLPLLGLILYSIVRARRSESGASQALPILIGIGAAQLMLLSIRFAYQGAAGMAHGAVTSAESWAYSALGLGVSGVLLAVGTLRAIPLARHASLSLLLLTTAKVFLLDLSGLEGIWRAASLLGLGTTLVAISLLYQRVILPRHRADTD